MAPPKCTEIAGAGWLAAFANAVQAAGQLSAAELALQVQQWGQTRLGSPPPVLYADQRHTAILYSFVAAGGLAPVPHCVGICDGLLTGERNVLLMVRTADCLPVVLAGDGVVATLHCGWRSLAGDVLGKCVRLLGAEYGVGAEALTAVIGVGIGPCHYEVGPEVVAALASLPSASSDWHREQRVDLAAWARGRLIAVGLSPPLILTLPGCTACSPWYHSFRRDGPKAGRQWAAALLTAPGD